LRRQRIGAARLPPEAPHAAPTNLLIFLIQEVIQCARQDRPP